MPEVIGSHIWGPPEATKPVILRSRINPSEGKTRQISRKILPALFTKIVIWRGFPGDDRTDC